MAGAWLLPNIQGDQAMEWRVHLARRRPGQAVAALAVIAAGSACAAIGFRGWWAGALAAIVMVGSIGDFLFPIRYVIGDAAAEARGLVLRRRVVWSQVRRVVRDELGVKLSTLRRPSRLEAYRGIYLWFEGNAADVMAAIAHHMEAAGGDDRQSDAPPPRPAGG